MRSYRLLKVLLLFPLLSLLSSCTHLLFFPQKVWVQNPMNQGLHYEDIVLIHPNGLRIHGWWIPAQAKQQHTPSKGTVYFLHGNAENISTHLMNIIWLPTQGYNLFLIDYRGYGLSDGRPSLEGSFADIELGLNWLSRSGKTQHKPLIVFGQSLGGAMTSYVLSKPENQKQVNCLILEAVFTGYPQIAKDVTARSTLLWPLQWSIAAMMPDQWNPIDHISNITPPKLIMHSTEDEVIPYSMGEQLFAAAAEPKQFVTLYGPHISGVNSTEVRPDILAFIERCN